MEHDKIIKKLKKQILKVSFETQVGHIPSAFSILEIIYCLYKNHLKKEEKFILSKGHGCLALYSVFLEMGIINEKEFFSFCSFDSILGGHPHRGKHKKIDASTGSLGHGLPMSVGIAIANKISQNDNRVFCLLGDGECNEGTTWESAMVAENLNLNNLICLIDENKSQSRSLPTNNIESKFKSFGWKVITVQNGHDLNQINKAIKLARKEQDQPVCIVCKTKKGNGIKDMEENMFSWHHGPPNKEQYEKFIEELDA